MKSMTLLCVLFAMTSESLSQMSICKRQPYGPMMCRKFCERFLGCSSHEFNASNLVCRVISDTSIFDSSCQDSDGKLTMATMSNTFDREDVTELDTCYNDYVEATRTKEQGSSGYTTNITMHRACKEGKLCVVEYILKNRLTDINCRGKLGRTPVMMAASMGQFTVFDYLVSEGCDLSAVDERDNNVLHVACIYGFTDIVRKLLESKVCDIESRGWHKLTPVMFAVQFGHRNVTDLLISKGCDVTSMSSRKENILHVACTGGHVDMVKYILSQDIVSIDSRGHSKMTPVIIAAGKGYTAVVDLLVSKGCNVKAMDVNRNNILHFACIGGHIDMVKYILRNNLSTIESRGFKGMTPVFKAVQRGHRNVVDLLVKEGCKVINDENNSILHAACVGGQVDIVNYILSENLFSIETKGFHGRTPVMMAAVYGKKAIFDLFVMKGCNLKAVDEIGDNILHLACIGGNVDIVEYIISKEMFGINSKGFLDRTPVMIAAQYGRRRVFDLLRRKGCYLGVKDNDGANLLHLACVGGHVDMVKYILTQNIVDVESRTQGYLVKTPLMLAVQYGHRKVFDLLVSKRCKLNVLDAEKNNILHIACYGGHIDMVKCILKKNIIDIESRGFQGRTPLLLAAECGHRKVFSFLLQRKCNHTVVDDNGNNVLHVACSSGNVHIVKYLIKRRFVDERKENNKGLTPLQIAQAAGQKAIVALLKVGT